VAAGNGVPGAIVSTREPPHSVDTGPCAQEKRPIAV